MNILMSIPATSTILVLPPFRKVGTSAACVTSSDLIASVCDSCSSVQTPQSGLLHCMPHGKPALPLAWLRVTTPALKGLSPVGTTIFLVYIHHSRHTHRFGNMAGFVRNRRFVLPLKFSDYRKFRLLYPPHRQAENR